MPAARVQHAPTFATPEAIRPPRPANLARSLFHAGMGTGGALLFLEVLTVSQARWIALALAATVWTLEALRRVYPGLNRALMAFFAPMAHAHEAREVNSATWFCTAVLGLALLTPGPAGILGLLAASVGDPAAGLVGRRWGRNRLASGRSLEGAAAFVAASLAVGVPYLLLWEPSLSGLQIATMAGAAALAGAAVELLVDRIDDNLAVPLAAAWAAWLVSALV